ncbi:MAG: DAPG hydrolase family protein [Acidimicrobiales bacterium]
MSKPGPESAIQLAEYHDLADFRRPMGSIPDRVQAAIDRGARTADASTFADPNRLLDVTAGGDGLGDDVVRLPSNELVVACLTEMPGVSSQMWDWWFSWHSYTSDRYQLWHPQDHVAASLAEDRRHVESIRARWVGNTSYVDEYIGGEMQKLAIRFVEPASVGLDPARVDRVGVAICARTVLRRERLAAGWLIHLVEDTADGCRMHSRFLLGDATSEIPLIGPLLTRIAGSARVRAKRLPDRVGLALLLHCSQEMNHLASILPELHARFGDE